MNKNLKMVEDFHLNFQNPVYTDMDDIPKERKLLRLKLAFEELCELAQALGVTDSFYHITVSIAEESLPEVDTNIVNKAEVLDALCDIEYINNGSIKEFGLENIYDTAFLAVHQSNMTKLCKDEIEAAQTVLNYEKQGIDTYFESNGKGKFIVKRKSDDKILKNINYTPFNASEIFK
jgi:predicted HAD superfamily Cof-like phosphohydrolase